MRYEMSQYSRTKNSPKSRLLYLWPLILICSPPRQCLQIICNFHIQGAAHTFIWCMSTPSLCLFVCIIVPTAHLCVFVCVVVVGVLIWYAVCSMLILPLFYSKNGLLLLLVFPWRGLCVVIMLMSALYISESVILIPSSVFQFQDDIPLALWHFSFPSISIGIEKQDHEVQSQSVRKMILKWH